MGPIWLLRSNSAAHSNNDSRNYMPLEILLHIERRCKYFDFPRPPVSCVKDDAADRGRDT